jgi:hypothetical protein
MAKAQNLLALAYDYPEQGRCHKRAKAGEEERRLPLGGITLKGRNERLE